MYTKKCREHQASSFKHRDDGDTLQVVGGVPSNSYCKKWVLYVSCDSEHPMGQRLTPGSRLTVYTVLCICIHIYIDTDIFFICMYMHIPILIIVAALCLCFLNLLQKSNLRIGSRNHVQTSQQPHIESWLVVWNILYFSIYWECHHPNWRTHIFQRGRYTTNQRVSENWVPQNLMVENSFPGEPPFRKFGLHFLDKPRYILVK